MSYTNSSINIVKNRVFLEFLECHLQLLRNISERNSWATDVVHVSLRMRTWTCSDVSGSSLLIKSSSNAWCSFEKASDVAFSVGVFLEDGLTLRGISQVPPKISWLMTRKKTGKPARRETALLSVPREKWDDVSCGELEPLIAGMEGTPFLIHPDACDYSIKLQ